jgi:hypothetical protein
VPIQVKLTLTAAMPVRRVWAGVRALPTGLWVTLRRAGIGISVEVMSGGISYDVTGGNILCQQHVEERLGLFKVGPPSNRSV